MVGKWVNDKLVEYIKDELARYGDLEMTPFSCKRESACYIIKTGRMHTWLLRDRDWARNILRLDEIIDDIRKEIY
jgi:hypothetical protein